MVANLIASRLTVLYGPSGVGKSSLLRASVARRLRALPEEPIVVVFDRWGEDPAAALAAAVADAAGLEDGPLRDVLERAQLSRDVYLILDQTEEYFLYHQLPTDIERDLADVIGSPLRVNAILAVREDALATLDRFLGRIPALYGNVLRLERLDDGAARSAIVGPIERFSRADGRARRHRGSARPGRHRRGRERPDPARPRRRRRGERERRRGRCRGPVPPGRHAAPVGRRTCERLRRASPCDARAARWRPTDRRRPPRASTRRADRRAAGSRRFGVRPARDSFRREDRPRARRLGRVRGRAGHLVVAVARLRWRNAGSCAATSSAATRSSTTSSPRRSSPGGAGTKPGGPSIASERPRGVGSGAWG